MTLEFARKLRDHIREKNDLYATVPLGHGPDGYFVRVKVQSNESKDFRSVYDWFTYTKAENERRRKVTGISASAISCRASPRPPPRSGR